MIAPKQKKSFCVHVETELLRQSRHILLDRGLSVAKFFDQCLRELLASTEKRSTVHYVKHHLQEK